jgi:tetratricopeptide (TPR) repeat protein
MESAGEVQARVEQLLRDAHIQRMRHHWGAAETLCRQALDLAPDDIMGQEMLADLLAEKGEFEAALELYRKALAAQPQKVSLEEKIGRTVLRKDEEDRERLAAQFMLESPKAAGERKRSSTAAVLISAACAGGGQIYRGQYLKGGIMLGVWLLSMFGWMDLFRVVLAFGGVGSADPRGGAQPAAANDSLAVLGLVGAVVYVYSLLDAAAEPKKARKPGAEL